MARGGGGTNSLSPHHCSDEVYAFDLSMDGKILVTASADGSVLTLTKSQSRHLLNQSVKVQYTSVIIMCCSSIIECKITSRESYISIIIDKYSRMSRKSLMKNAVVMIDNHQII